MTKSSVRPKVRAPKTFLRLKKYPEIYFYPRERKKVRNWQKQNYFKLKTLGKVVTLKNKTALFRFSLWAWGSIFNDFQMGQVNINKSPWKQNLLGWVFIIRLKTIIKHVFNYSYQYRVSSTSYHVPSIKYHKSPVYSCYSDLRSELKIPQEPSLTQVI